MTADLKTAKEVSEHLLRLTGDALMSRNFEAFARCFHLPQTMNTMGRRIVAETRCDLRRAFESNCDHLAGLGVTELRRECVAAIFHGENRVEATHMACLLKDGQELVPAYPVFSVLEKRADHWVIMSSEYALDDQSGGAKALHAAEAGDPAAEAIYQEHLDVLSKALITGDFATFQSRISLPHRITTETDVFQIETLAEMQDLFERFARNYANEGLTDFVRTVRQAKFVTPDEIVGTHISHQMRHGQRILPPYPNRVRLVRSRDGHWRETHCTNAILNNFESFRLWTRVAETPRLPDFDQPSKGT